MIRNPKNNNTSFRLIIVKSNNTLDNTSESQWWLLAGGTGSRRLQYIQKFQWLLALTFRGHVIYIRTHLYTLEQIFLRIRFIQFLISQTYNHRLVGIGQVGIGPGDLCPPGYHKKKCPKKNFYMKKYRQSFSTPFTNYLIYCQIPNPTDDVTQCGNLLA